MKTKSIVVLLSLGTSLLAGLSTARAAVLASDSFESYSTGPLSGQSGGTGWTGGWTAPGAATRADLVDTTSNPLDFTPGGGLLIDGATRALEVQLIPAATGNQLCGVRTLSSPIAQTFYAGFLVRYTGPEWAGANNTFTLHLSTNSSQTATLNFGLRGGAANEFMLRYGTGAPVTGASTGGDLVNNTDYYLVVRVSYLGGVFTSANLWLNPSATDEADTPNGDASLTLTPFANPITHVFFRQAALQADDIIQADELKLGTEWIDVVPYPAGPKIPEVRVETLADGTGTVVPAQDIVSGQSITMYAIARDAGGNYLSNAPASWSVENVTGGITGANLVASGNKKSAVFTASLAGTANVRATAYATNLVDSGTLTVVAGPAAQVRVETAPDDTGTVVPAQDIISGATIRAFAVSRDAAGNFLANVAATWSLQNKTSGVVDADLVADGDNKAATFTGNLSGTANIRATSGALAAVDSGMVTVSRFLTWVGGGANPWDFVAANWTTGTPVAFLDQDDVVFEAGGSQSPAVNVTTTVQPHSVNITGGTYTIDGTGKISGRTSLTNSSGGLLTLLNENDYAGLTVVNLNSTLQLGNGVKNGSFGRGTVRIDTGGSSPVFNRTDVVGSPYVVSNTIAGVSDFIIEVKTGAVKLAGAGVNAHATALVRNAATLLLGKDVNGGSSLGNATFVSGTVLNIETGGKVKLDSPVTDHITGAGKIVQIDGTFDVNGYPEAFGIIQGTGVIDNTGVSNAVLTVNQGATAFGQNGETSMFEGVIRNSGTRLLGITKDSTNTLVLVSANTYGGDTRIVGGGILELGNVSSVQNSTLDRQSGDTGNLSFGSLTSANLGGLKGARGFGLTNSSGAAVALTIGGNGQTNTFSGVLSEGGSLIKNGAGIQTLSGTNTYAGSTTVSLGTLLVNGGLSGSGAVSVGGSGTLGGTGFINGALGVSGTLRPGNNAIGKLTVSNTVTLSGATVMEISRTTTTNSDNLTATGITLGGSLTVTNLVGTLQAGNSFQLFSAPLTGSISIGSLPPLWPGLTWNTSGLSAGGNGSVVVAGTPIPPVISAVSSSGGNLTLSGSGGLSGATYYVVSTNNVAAPLATWPRIQTNTFASDGKFTNSIPINLATPQAYFGIQVP